MQVEPSQPQPLDYEASRPSSSAVLTAFRIVAFVALIAWGYWITVQLRCWGAGSLFRVTLLVAMMYVGPFACAAFLGMRWRRYLLAVFAAILLPAVVAEAQATLEEQMFLASVKNLPRNAAAVSKPRRWWPCETSFLYYDPATQKLGGGD